MKYKQIRCYRDKFKIELNDDSLLIICLRHKRFLLQTGCDGRCLKEADPAGRPAGVRHQASGQSPLYIRFPDAA
jgi:hypothetical protein